MVFVARSSCPVSHLQQSTHYMAGCETPLLPLLLEMVELFLPTGGGIVAVFSVVFLADVVFEQDPQKTKTQQLVAGRTIFAVFYILLRVGCTTMIYSS